MSLWCRPDPVRLRWAGDVTGSGGEAVLWKGSWGGRWEMEVSRTTTSEHRPHYAVSLGCCSEIDRKNLHKVDVIRFDIRKFWPLEPGMPRASFLALAPDNKYFS